MPATLAQLVAARSALAGAIAEYYDAVGRQDRTPWLHHDSDEVIPAPRRQAGPPVRKGRPRREEDDPRRRKDPEIARFVDG